MSNLSCNSFYFTKQRLLMAAASELPSTFDVIVIGTGLEESIVAAAASRNGHSVLHIDSNDYYGGQWAAFTLDGIQHWADSLQQVVPTVADEEASEEKGENLKTFLANGESLIEVEKSKASFKNVKQNWFVSEKKEKESVDDLKPDAETSEKKSEVDDGLSQEVAVECSGENSDDRTNRQNSSTACKEAFTKASIMSQSKRFSLDLIPHLLFSRGAMVELLIKSNISRYTEFKSVSRVLTILNGVLEHVPSSRSDVFSTKHISVIEKRILMKFIKTCVNYEANPDVFDAFKDKSFYEFLRHEKLTPNLIYFVLHSIAMVDKSAAFLEGLAATQKFLLSLGRFGNSPFLWPMYGSGELPQAFCRLCAVFGGVYYLDRPVDAFVVNEENQVVAIISKGQRIDCKYLVVNSKMCPEELKGEKQDVTVSRKTCLLSESVMPSDSGEQLSFVSLAPDVTKTENFVFAEEVSYAGAVCPKGIYCLHLTSENDQDHIGIKNSLETLVPDPSKMIWSIEFDIQTEVFSDPTNSAKLSNLYLTSGPVFELDFDGTIDRAKVLFSHIFKDEEFLPRAPDPEEIIIGGDDEPQAGSVENEDVSSPADENGTPMKQVETGSNEVSKESVAGLHDEDLHKEFDD